MAAYATTEDIEAGFRPLSGAEASVAESLIDEAAVMIDAANAGAGVEAKRVVTCHMVRRAISSASASVPMGATQGTVTAGPYSQSWAVGSSGGSVGELYLTRADKALLGVSAQIGQVMPACYTE